jgi:hypothetical protein
VIRYPSRGRKSKGEDGLCRAVYNFVGMTGVDLNDAKGNRLACTTWTGSHETLRFSVESSCCGRARKWTSPAALYEREGRDVAVVVVKDLIQRTQEGRLDDVQHGKTGGSTKGNNTSHPYSHRVWHF